MNRVAFVTLGCSKNQVDSEVMEALLAAKGYELSDEPEAAEVVVVHTCGFIEAAKEESIHTILTAARLKDSGQLRKLVVTGCLAQRFGEELAAEIPEIDVLTGTGGLENIGKLLERAIAGERVLELGKPGYLFNKAGIRRVQPGAVSGYLKIAEGCNHSCSFCAIPQMRGPYVSRPLDEVLEEARYLAGSGLREVNLIAQDTTGYGLDLGGFPMLPSLLAKLVQIPGVRWWRLFYAYPQTLSDEVLELMAGDEKICNYLDIPIQHCQPGILRAMGRPGSPEQLLRMVRKIRQKVPGIALRTTLIVGFPGETEQDFHLLLDFMSEAAFDWAGVFAFSPEEGTTAADLPGQVPPAVKEDRYRRAMERQQQITSRVNNRLVGKTLPVLIEGLAGDREGYFVGRSERHGPEVDGVVYVQGKDLKRGSFCPVKITAADDYDLTGESI